ncbi:hypothetical protein IAT40_005048 [Kwoniella sp. CBS 6097]
MYAPPGVDTSSSGEDTTPPPSPELEPNRHHFSFRSLFTSTRRSRKQGPTKEEIKTSTPIEAAEADPTLDTDPIEPKKRVRIFAGELEKGAKVEGLTDNQGEDVVDLEQASEQDPAVEAVVDLAPLEPAVNKSTKDTDGVAGEVLTLLRKLMAESIDPEHLTEAAASVVETDSHTELTDVISKLRDNADKPVKGSLGKSEKEKKKGNKELETLKVASEMTKEAASTSEPTAQTAPLPASDRYPGLPPHFFDPDGKLLPCHPPGMHPHEYHPSSSTPRPNAEEGGLQSALTMAASVSPAKEGSGDDSRAEPHLMRGPKRDIHRDKEKSIESSRGEVGDTRTDPSQSSLARDKPGATSKSPDRPKASSSDNGAAKDSTCDKKRADLEAVVKKYKARYADAKKAYSKEDLSKEQKKEAKDQLRRAEAKLKEAMQALQALKSTEKGGENLTPKVKSNKESPGKQKEVTRTELETTQPQIHSGQEDMDGQTSKGKAPTTSRAAHDEKKTDGAEDDKRTELEAIVLKYRKRYDELKKAYSKTSDDKGKENLKGEIKRVEGMLKEAMQAIEALKVREKEKESNQESVAKAKEFVDAVAKARDEGRSESRSGSEKRSAEETGRSTKADKQIKEPVEGAIEEAKGRLSTEHETRAVRSSTSPASPRAEREGGHAGDSSKIQELETLVNKYKARREEAIKIYKRAGLDDKGKAKAKDEVRRAERKLNEAMQSLDKVKSMPTTSAPSEKTVTDKDVSSLTSKPPPSSPSRLAAVADLQKNEVASDAIPEATTTPSIVKAEAESHDEPKAAPNSEDRTEIPSGAKDSKTNEEPDKAELQSQYSKLTRRLRSNDLTAHEREKFLRKAERLKSLLSPMPSPRPSRAASRSAEQVSKKVVDKEAVLQRAKDEYEALVQGIKEDGIDAEERKKRDAAVRKQKYIVMSLMAETKKAVPRSESRERTGEAASSKTGERTAKSEEEGRNNADQKPKSGGVTPDQVDKAIRKAAKERGEETPPRTQTPPLAAESASAVPLSTRAREEETVEPSPIPQRRSTSPTSKPANGATEKHDTSYANDGDGRHQAWAPLKTPKKRTVPPTPALPPKSPARGPSPRISEKGQNEKRLSRASGLSGKADRTDLAEEGRVESVSWSKTLVSLAHCIDLANTLLTSLLARKGPNPLISIIQHLVAGLMMQRDLLNSLKVIVGEGNGELLDDFGRHVSVIKRYVESLMEERKRVDAQRLEEGERLVQGGSQLLENVSVQGVVSHLMTFTEYLTPGMMAALRAVFEEWKNEGMCVKSVLFTVTIVRRELLVILRQESQELDGVLMTKRLIGILDRILAFIAPETVQTGEGSFCVPPKQTQGLTLPRPVSLVSPPLGHEDVVIFPSPPFRKPIQGSRAFVRDSDATLTHWDEEAEKRVQRDVALRRLTGDARLDAPASSPPIPQGFTLPNTSEPFLSPKLYPHESPHQLQTKDMTVPTIKKSKSMSFRTLRRGDRDEEAPSSLAYLRDKISNTFHRRHEASPFGARGPAHSPVNDMHYNVSLTTRTSPSEPNTPSRRKARPKPIIAPSPSRGNFGTTVPRNRGVDEACDDGTELKLPQTTQEFLSRSKSWKKALMSPLIPSSSAATFARPGTAPLPVDASSKIRQHSRKRSMDQYHHKKEVGQEEWRLHPGKDKGSTIIVPPHSLRVHRPPTPPDPGSAPAQTLYPHSRSRHRSAGKPQHLPPSAHSAEESSPSIYSPSIAFDSGSESTLESDVDARRLLALADSGPRPVRHDWRDSLDHDSEDDKKKKKREPSAREVKRAESLLYHKTLATPAPVKSETSRKRGMTVHLV